MFRLAFRQTEGLIGSLTRLLGLDLPVPSQAIQFSVSKSKTQNHNPLRILVLGLDNAGWHTAPNLVVPEGLRLVYLPRYSPELQPADTSGPCSTSRSPTSTSRPSPISNAPSQTVAGSSMAISSVSGQTSTGGPSQPSRLISRIW